jgi:predicted amino acid racemase
VSAPRLEIRLDRIRHNALSLTSQLAAKGVSVCGVTKASLGSPEIAHEYLVAGVRSLGDSRIENIEALRSAGISAEIMLIRSPMLSQVERVVASADLSLNSELEVIAGLSKAALRQDRVHGVVLMVELGDLREGVMAADVMALAEGVHGLKGVRLRGVGTNLACQSGVIPDEEKMAELSVLAESIERGLGVDLDVISGGNSANLPWALDSSVDVGRINHLRLGESLLLGREPLGRSILAGLRADAISLVGEVIEVQSKPAEPWGQRGQSAFGDLEHPECCASTTSSVGERVLVALGRQDVDVDGLSPPAGYEILGSSSDHLVLAARGAAPVVGSELRFELNYSALMRSMASSFVTRHYLRSDYRAKKMLTIGDVA